MEEYSGPTYIRVGRAKTEVIYDDSYEFKVGKADVLKKGADATIIACGIMVPEALKAAEELLAEGVSAGVINMSTIKPIDLNAVVEAAKDSGAIVTAEEHSIIGGLGSAVAEVLSEVCPVPLRRIGIKDVFGTSGTAGRADGALRPDGRGDKGRGQGGDREETPTTREMIQFYHVTKSYDGRRPAVSDISFRLQKGEMVYLTGPSGAGKSTIIKLILCAEEPDDGQILVAGRNVARLKQRDIPGLRRSIGVVFQDFKLIERKTVYENVALSLRVAGAREEKIKDRTDTVLKALDLHRKKDNYPLQLSGGEQQRAALARALVKEPVILLADEPTGNLDFETTQNIMSVIKDINAQGPR